MQPCSQSATSLQLGVSLLGWTCQAFLTSSPEPSSQPLTTKAVSTQQLGEARELVLDSP